MTARALTILVLLTVAMTAAAGFALWQETAVQSPAGTGERVFPGLLERIERLSAVTIRTAGGQLTIVRQGRGWGLKERDGYPVPFERVKETVLAMAALEKVEPKTTRTDRYPRLGVEDVDTPGATSREVSLIDDQGQVLARLIVGKPAYGLSGEGGLYVRIPGEERAWAVRGSLAGGVEPRDWVERTVIDIPGDSIAEVRIVHADGQKLAVVRGGEGALALAGMPPGAKLKRPDDLDAFVRALTALSLEDIRPAAGVDFAKDKTLKATFATRDGLSIAVELVSIDNRQWIRLAAHAQDPAAGGLPQEKAAMLNAQWKGWAYQVPTWKLSALQRRQADLIEKPGS